VRIARKHIGWYTRGLPGGEAFRREANAIESAPAQLAAVGRFFDGLSA
jgi:tRNA-dihydrouridine synthase B